MKKIPFYLFFLLMFACQEQNAIPSVESMETTDRTFIEGNTDLFIPQNARNLQAYLEGASRETSFYIKFIATSQDVDKVIQSSTCNTPLKNSDSNWTQPNDYLKHLEWWTPEKAKTYLWCYGEMDTTHHSIFIDTTNAEEYMFYILDSSY